mgnify:CR=1 FL=1
MTNESGIDVDVVIRDFQRYTRKGKQAPAVATLPPSPVDGAAVAPLPPPPPPPVTTTGGSCAAVATLPPLPPLPPPNVLVDGAAVATLPPPPPLAPPMPPPPPPPVPASSAIPADVEQAICEEARLKHWSARESAFRWCRRLKNTTAKDHPAKSLRSITRECYNRMSAPPFAFVDYYAKFLKGWELVRLPLGQTTLTQAFDFGREFPSPVPGLEDEQDLAVLAGACEALQRSAGDAPFYLSGYSVAEHLLGDRGKKDRAYNLLMVLEGEGVIVRTKIGDRPIKGEKRTDAMRASQYRMVGGGGEECPPAD